MSDNSNTVQEQQVHTLENGIIVTLVRESSQLSKLTLSGTWYECMHVGPMISNDDYQVHGWQGPFGFCHQGQLDRKNKTFTCYVFANRIEKDLESLATQQRL